jgi:hypothetical protein
MAYWSRRRSGPARTCVLGEIASIAISPRPGSHKQLYCRLPSLAMRSGCSPLPESIWSLLFLARVHFLLVSRFDLGGQCIAPVYIDLRAASENATRREADAQTHYFRRRVASTSTRSRAAFRRRCNWCVSPPTERRNETAGSLRLETNHGVVTRTLNSKWRSPTVFGRGSGLTFAPKARYELSGSSCVMRGAIDGLALCTGAADLARGGPDLL